MGVMRTTFFGQTGLRVSELCLGTMTFGTDWGWGADEPTSRAILDLFDEAGGSFVDTADAYTNGSSEAILGRLLEGRRERFAVATKYTLASGKGPNGQGNGRKNLRRSLEASLRRLRTDYVDVLWVHMFDGVTPVEETIRALDDAVRAGKVLHIGFSDFPAWTVSRADALAEARGLTRPAAIQVEHNLVMRDAERDLLPMADALGMGVCAWSPLGGGALTTGRASGSRAGTGHFDGYATERTARVAAAVADVAEELGCTRAQLAIAWCRGWSPLAVPVVGARTLEQARDNLAAADVRIPDHVRQRLAEASAFDLGFPHDFLRENAARWWGEEIARFDLRARPSAARTLGLTVDGTPVTVGTS
jgi:aryl-alcohol dehydrogenase-like predicted oxidoreductase